MKTVEIEKGVPIPQPKTGKTIDYSFPFNTMEVGDSFAITSDEESDMKTMHLYLTNKVSNLKHNPLYKTKSFSLRTKRDGKTILEIRVWRIK